MSHVSIGKATFCARDMRLLHMNRRKQPQTSRLLQLLKVVLATPNVCTHEKVKLNTMQEMADKVDTTLPQ